MTKCCCPCDQSSLSMTSFWFFQQWDLLTAQTSSPVRGVKRRVLSPMKSINPSCPSDPFLNSGLRIICLCFDYVRAETEVPDEQTLVDATPRAASEALSPSAILGSTLLGSPFTVYGKSSLFHLKKNSNWTFPKMKTQSRIVFHSNKKG